MNNQTKDPVNTVEISLRIGGTNLRVTQFMDYPDFNDPNQRHISLINFADAELADMNAHQIYKGFISVRINTAMTPAALSIINRLLSPFNGYFVMVVNGTYTINDNFAEVQASDVTWTNIQPTYGTGKAEGVVTPIE